MKLNKQAPTLCTQSHKIDLSILLVRGSSPKTPWLPPLKKERKSLPFSKVGLILKALESVLSDLIYFLELEPLISTLKLM